MDLFRLVGYRRRWQLLSLIDEAYVSATAPVVLGGCGSSGTTIVHRVLGAHPAVFAGPESTVLLPRVSAPEEIAARFALTPARVIELQRQSRSQAEFVDLFQSECLARSGKRVWSDKAPNNVTRLDFLFRHFPKARFVHVIRDGRDVVCSLQTRPWMKLGDGARGTPRGMDAAAKFWADAVAAGIARRGDPRYHEVRYEAFVADPEAVMRPLLDFLGLAWDEAVAAEARARNEGFDAGAPDQRDKLRQPVNAAAVGRWRVEMTAAEAAVFKNRAGALLIALGYAENEGWRPSGA